MEVKTVKLTNLQLGFKPKRNHIYNLNIIMIVLFALLSRDFFSSQNMIAFIFCVVVFSLTFSLFLFFEMIRFSEVHDNLFPFFESKYDKDRKTRKDKVVEFWENVKKNDENIMVLHEEGKAQPYKKTIHNGNTKKFENKLSLYWGGLLLYSVDDSGREICLEGLPSRFKNTVFEEVR